MATSKLLDCPILHIKGTLYLMSYQYGRGNELVIIDASVYIQSNNMLNCVLV